MGYCLIRYILAQLVLSRVIRNGRSIALKSLLPSHFWSEFYKKTTEGFLAEHLAASVSLQLMISLALQ